MTEFVVTRVDSTSKLIEMEDIASRLAGAPFQFETVLAGECTMYVARMRTAQAKRDVALMPVYASPTMALAGPTMLGRSFTLMAEITAWAREELGVATLLVPSKQQQQGVVLTETVIKKRSKRTGLPVVAMRAHGICFKRKVRGKRWNASKGCWINRTGQNVVKPKWGGENAFVADFWAQTPFRRIDLALLLVPPPPVHATLESSSPMLFDPQAIPYVQLCGENGSLAAITFAE